MLFYRIAQECIFCQFSWFLIFEFLSILTFHIKYLCSNMLEKPIATNCRVSNFFPFIYKILGDKLYCIRNSE